MKSAGFWRQGDRREAGDHQTLNTHDSLLVSKAAIPCDLRCLSRWWLRKNIFSHTWHLYVRSSSPVHKQSVTKLAWCFGRRRVNAGGHLWSATSAELKLHEAKWLLNSVVLGLLFISFCTAFTYHWSHITISIPSSYQPNLKKQKLLYPPTSLIKRKWKHLFTNQRSGAYKKIIRDTFHSESSLF